MILLANPLPPFVDPDPVVYEREQPKSGESAFVCGHAEGCHWHLYAEPVPFRDVNGDAQEARWLVTCDACEFDRFPRGYIKLGYVPPLRAVPPKSQA